MNELDLFTAALAVANSAERKAFLDRECAGNLPLRERLAKLVEAHLQSHPLLDQPVPGGLGQTQAFIPSEQPGAIIAGRYKLLEEIGEGGMGTVWVAEQTEPVRRKVALKLIKAGMDSRSVLARFEAERQALAVMDHPNIAKVLDGGLTETGRPYFVMEYVKGVPITEYCDATRLSVQQRLNLFVQVCQAVQHAHQKGIIHRDLKPSNILVAPYDDLPVPKVIDFGLAKAMHQSLTEKTLHTAHETVLGTPLYMSPEQAQLNNIDVDTRSDIYSLGVLLYELLTGTTPLEKQRFKEAAWDEVKRIIREEEPPRPSMRISSTATLPSLAAGRQIEPARLTKLVRGELDWIVMKSLEKDRSRRYDTANGFAADINRYLAGEAVQAHPPSAGYRLRKFARKNRAELTTGAMFLFILMSAVAFSTYQAMRALISERKAQEAMVEAVAAQYAEKERAEGERLAKLEAQANEKLAGERLVQVEAERKKADAAKVEAQAKEAEANAVVAFFENQVFAAARPKGQNGGLGKEVSLRDAIAASLPALGQGFAAQPLVEARLRLALGKTFGYLAEHEQARDQFEQSRNLSTRHSGPEHPYTLANMSNLANIYAAQNRPAEALKLREEVLEIQQRVLPKDHPETLMSMNNLAISYADLNRHAEALKLIEEVLEIHQRVLPKDDPHTLSSMNNLAIIYYFLNRPAEALKLHEEVLEIRRRVLPKDDLDTVKSMGNLANCYADLNRHAEALKLHEEVLEIQQRVLPKDHPETLMSMNNLAHSYTDLNRPSEALKLLEEVLEIRRRVLPKDDPHTLKSMGVLAQSLIQLDRGAEAIPLIDECVATAAGQAVDPSLIPGVIALRMGHFRKVRDSVGCRATAEMWEKLNGTDAESLYNAACFRAITAAVEAKTPGADAARLAKDDADRAMEWLQKAVQADYKDAAHMAKDTDLDPLRDREDFKKLLAELEKK